MLRFWTLRKLDATLLDALIATRFWVFLGGYERWMLWFWMLRKLDAMLLDASILTRFGYYTESGES